MKVTYDPEVDVLNILLRTGDVHESEELRPGIIVDYDQAGHLMGIEILDAKQHVANPHAFEYEVADRSAVAR